jgi:hypothetical protein
VGPATLADVFWRAGFEEQIRRTPPVRHSDVLGANSLTDNPYDRMRLVLERGWLKAIHAEPCGTVEEEKEIHDEWKTLFRQLTDTQRIPASPTLAERTLAQPRSYVGGGEIRFRREQVIEAEARISGEEFEWRFWTITQILGWLAYRAESKFRSLEQADLVGRSYRGLKYANDFESDNLGIRLVDILLRSGIRSYRGNEEVGVGQLTSLSTVWEFSDVTFVRDELLANRIANSLREQAFALYSSALATNDQSTGEGPLTKPRQRVGRPLGRRLEVEEQMQKDIEAGAVTLDALRKWKGSSLGEHYKAHPDTAKAAREAVLRIAESVGNSIPVINGKK